MGLTFREKDSYMTTIWPFYFNTSNYEDSHLETLPGEGGWEKNPED